MDSGARPAALNFGISASRSSQVFGGGGADLGEDVLVVVEHHRLHRIVGQGVGLAVDLPVEQHRREEPAGQAGRFHLAGQVDDLLGGDVGLEGAAAPVVDQGGRLAGADGGADLLLVGVVGEELSVDLGAGVGRVPAGERGAEGCLVTAGQGPRRRAPAPAGCWGGAAGCGRTADTGGARPAGAAARGGGDQRGRHPQRDRCGTSSGPSHELSVLSAALRFPARAIGMGIRAGGLLWPGGSPILKLVSETVSETYRCWRNSTMAGELRQGVEQTKFVRHSSRCCR